MCDPISLIAAAGSVVSAGIGYMGEQSTMDAQQKANDDWVASQQQQAAQARAADEAARQKAEAARQQTLSQVTPQAQTQTQQQASQTLVNQMGAYGTGPASDPNTAVLGANVGDQGSPANPAITDQMARTITQATRDAQGRIQALANLQGYGGAFGSAAANVNTALAQGNQAIGLQSDIRQGIARTLGIAQQVPPVQYAQGQNIAGSLAGSLANIAGSKIGSSLKSGASFSV
jgi:hypothetical protein